MTGRNKWTTGGRTGELCANGAIVDVVREVTLCGPQGADSRPDLPILHTAQPLSCCNYLPHCERVCICVCFGGRGVVGDSTCTWPGMQTNPVFPINYMKEITVGHTHPTWDPDSPGPLPFWLPVITCGPMERWEPLCAACVALREMWDWCALSDLSDWG